MWEKTGPASPAAEPDVPPGEPVELVLVWTGISNLHRSFFSDAAATTALSTALGGRVGGPANILVRYDSKAFTGQIRLQLRPDTRLLPVRAKGDLVQLQDLAPITRALAAYRSAVASHYDFRVENFEVGIESTRKATTCVFVPAGTPPPDGTVVSPCVEVTGQRECGTPTPDGVRFTPEVARAVRGCLDL